MASAAETSRKRSTDSPRFIEEVVGLKSVRSQRAFSLPLMLHCFSYLKSMLCCHQQCTCFSDSFNSSDACIRLCSLASLPATCRVYCKVVGQCSRSVMCGCVDSTTTEKRVFYNRLQHCAEPPFLEQ